MSKRCTASEGGGDVIPHPNRRTLSPLERRAFRRAVKRGARGLELARQFRSSWPTIARWLRELKLELVKRPRVITGVLSQNAARVEEMLAAKTSASKIAATFGVSTQWVWQWRRERAKRETMRRKAAA
jgi:hypothetical protein